MTRLIRIDWPDYGTPDTPPTLSLKECSARLQSLRAAAAAAGHDAIVVYGDREHAANLHWLTGFDPRFEEAVLVVTPGDALAAGRERVPCLHGRLALGAGGGGPDGAVLQPVPSIAAKGWAAVDRLAGRDACPR
jgi:hypothetical protein